MAPHSSKGRKRLHVAVLGGGLQGCCIALALADKGVRVTLFDCNASLLSRAAIANEGKIHLGLMYAGDPTLRTARMMMRGALVFAPFFARHLGLDDAFDVSDPAVYVVHRNSQKSADEIQAYFSAVHSLLGQASDGENRPYFGMDLGTAIRRWSKPELSRELNPDEVLAAFDSPEVAIDPNALARLIRDRLADTPQVELRLQHEVTAVKNEDRLTVVSTSPLGSTREQFNHVVNALWDGRIAIDSSMGLRPPRRWIHRLKYGVSFRPPAGAQRLRSITVVLGPFGEVVSYQNGSVYLTWYPDCLKARTADVRPPAWPIYPGEPDRSEILTGTHEALSRILPALAQCRPSESPDVVVRGGPIVAWGETDIDDPESELHRRFEIGVTSFGSYHSVDPGKLTMAPFFAIECARRIVGDEAGHPRGARPKAPASLASV